MMSSGLEIYIFIGTITLLIASYQDIKSMKINLKSSYVMKGIALTAAYVHGLNMIIYFGITILTIGINHYILRDKFGEGDKVILLWMLPGFYLYGLIWLPVFLFLFGLILAANSYVKRIVKADKTPAVPLITAIWIITTLLYFSKAII